jgi:hypothetical protein
MKIEFTSQELLCGGEEVRGGELEWNIYIMNVYLYALLP